MRSVASLNEISRVNLKIRFPFLPYMFFNKIFKYFIKKILIMALKRFKRGIFFDTGLKCYICKFLIFIKMVLIQDKTIR